MNYSIEKVLTSNDLCEVSNQSGIYVNKKQDIINFFPPLNLMELNPRVPLQFSDQYGSKWDFNFVYYNNKRVADGTRDEYRLTGMTAFFKQHPGRPGDVLVLKKDFAGYHIVLIPSANMSGKQLDISWIISITVR